MDLWNTSSEISESSSWTFKILRQSFLPYCSKLPIFWLDEKTLFWRLPMSFHIHWETPPVYLFFLSENWLLTLESNSVDLEPVSLCQICSHQKLIRDGSRTTATSKMERFVIIVNGWKPTIITKRSILDVAAVLDAPLLLYQLYHPSMLTILMLLFSPILQ